MTSSPTTATAYPRPADAAPRTKGVVEIRNRRPPTGLFQPTEEKDLDEVLRQIASDLSGDPAMELMMIPQMVGPYGVPDMVVAAFNKKDVGERLKIGAPPILSEYDSRIVAATSPDQERNLDAIAELSQFPRSTCQRRVSRLVRDGIILRSGDLYLRCAEVKPLNQMWTIEAKVSDWRRGLGQATRYRLWSDWSLLTLANLPKNPAPLVAESRRLGIGLLHRDRWIVRPIRKETAEHRRLWASEHFFASL